MKTKERLEQERKEKLQRLIDIRFGKKENFVIPTPDGGEAEDAYISRCMAAIGGEYDTQEQALAVCYAQLDK